MTINRHRRRAGYREGFTLVELLVVIGIIVVLFTIATPIIMTARRNAERTRAQADLNTVALALEAYKSDFKDYPRPDVTTAASAGRAVLAWALIGPFAAVPEGSNPGDGADGPGFRTSWDPANKSGSKVWGPYLPPDKFKVETENGSAYLLDQFGSRIEYFPRWRLAKPGTKLFGVASSGDPSPLSDMKGGTGLGVYDCRQATLARVVGNPMRTQDDAVEPGPQAIYYLQRALGDGVSGTHDDDIGSGEQLTVTPPPFILLSRGYTKTFSPKVDVDKSFTKTSEVSNLQIP